MGETIPLQGEPLILVSQAGVRRWIETGTQHSFSYDQVRDPLDGQMKYRGVYEKEGKVCPLSWSMIQIRKLMKSPPPEATAQNLIRMA